MSLLSRLFRQTTTTVVNRYLVTDAPDVPTTALARTTFFRPEEVTVEYRDGHFYLMQISGPSTSRPAIKVSRNYARPDLVPEWAHRYVSEEAGR